MFGFETLSLVGFFVWQCTLAVCFACLNFKLCDLNGILKYQICEGTFPFSFSPTPTIFFSKCKLKSIVISSHNLFM